MIVMAVGRTAHPNHAGIYLGNDPSLPREEVSVFGLGPFMLHHLYGKPSELIVYGGTGTSELAWYFGIAKPGSRLC